MLSTFRVQRISLLTLSAGYTKARRPRDGSHWAFTLLFILPGSANSKVVLSQTGLDQKVDQFLARTFAVSTNKTYACHRRRFVTFCESYGYIPVPVSSLTLCRYAAFLAQSLGYSSIVQYFNVIRIMHQEVGLPNPLMGDFRLTCVLRGIRREKGDSKQMKAPLTPLLLQLILSRLDPGRADHSNVWAAILVSFYGMLRKSNVVPSSQSAFNPKLHLRRRDVSLHSDHVQIRVRWSKTIQFRQRELLLPLPRIVGSPICPVQAVYHAFSLTPQANPDGPAFVTHQLIPICGPTLVATIKTSLQYYGYDSRDYAGHSLRRGGASCAFNAGISVDIIRQIGDWQSNCYVKYIVSDFESLKTGYKSFLKP